MSTDLEVLTRDWLARIGAAADPAALEAERVAALGKQGEVTQLLKTPGRHDAGGKVERRPPHPRAARGRHRGDRGAQGGARRRRTRSRLAAETLDMTLPVEMGRGAASTRLPR